MVSLRCPGRHEKIVKILLKNRADPNFQDSNGRMPLSWAAQKGRERIVQMVPKKELRVRLNDGRSPMLPTQVAVEGVEEIMHGMMRVSAVAPIFQILSWSTGRGSEKVVKMLLAKGAKPDLPDNSGRTPLSFATEGGHEMAFDILLEKEADPNLQDHAGRTPLSWATSQTTG
ncbi:hypothetical protein VTN00DRAFT_6992 [Thermoascus crustaceus]|uniref:uncharacterized protein n=1 Tax=Thermoascus crustaceus TaxID=5088 RepID=UPI003742CFFB